MNTLKPSLLLLATVALSACHPFGPRHGPRHGPPHHHSIAAAAETSVPVLWLGADSASAGGQTVSLAR